MSYDVLVCSECGEWLDEYKHSCVITTPVAREEETPRKILQPTEVVISPRLKKIKQFGTLFFKLDPSV
jgi:hypothetical protein